MKSDVNFPLVLCKPTSQIIQPKFNQCKRFVLHPHFPFIYLTISILGSSTIFGLSLKYTLRFVPSSSTYQCVYIIDYFHQDFIYASDNLAYLCGLEPEQLMDAGYQMYIDHVPDADLQMLLEVNKKGFDLFNELPVGDRLDYTISYDFHLTNGKYSRLIHHHLTPILLSDDGRIWLALCTVSLAATDEPGHIIMQKNGERSYFEYSTSRHKWEKKEGITLSETERDVLRLSAQGYTMNDIADRLCKSVDTIKACKRNLFAKMGVKNIAEALFHAANYQMI